MFNDSMQGVSTLSLSMFASVKDIIESNNVESILDETIQFVNG